MSPPELVTSAAILIAGQVYAGQTHESAWINALDSGAPIAARPDGWHRSYDYCMAFCKDGGAQDGFLTSAGRFVSRREAFALARQAGQVRQKVRDADGFDSPILCAEHYAVPGH